MKSLKIKHIISILVTVLFFSSLVYAEPSIELVPGTANENNETDIAVRLKNHTGYTEQLKASGTAFTLEFSDGVTIAEVTSPFFDTFVNQFNAVPDGPEPGSYTVPDGFPAPIVTNDDGITKTMVAAARCTPTSESNDLMIIKVIATKNGTVTLKPTVLNNPSAGYTEDTKIDVLVGSDSNKGPTDPDAYPVLIGSDMAAILTNVGPYSGGDDIDNDGLPDSWEKQYFDTIDVTNGTTDYDHDGYSDAQEHVNNTDPTLQNDAGGTGYNELTDYRVTNLDIDGNGTAALGSDGVLLLRYLYNLRNDKLIVGAVEPSCVRCDATAIQDYIAKVKDAIYDVDGSGTVDLGSDGVIILRYMYNLRNEKLIDSAIGNNATRQTATEIQNYISPLIP
jgi:hypothetical protein